MKKLGNFLNKTEEWVLIILMTLLAVLVFLQVVTRTFGKPMTWTEELARYVTIWATFIGASYGFRFGAHIGVEAFKSWLPFRIRRIVDLIADLVVMVISALMMYYAYSIIVNVHLKFGQVSPAIRMPMWIAYLAMPVGYFAMTVRNLVLSIQCVKDIKAGKLTDGSVENGGGAAI